MTNTVMCLKWGNKYSAEYVNILYAMVNRNLTIPFDFVCVTENPSGLDKGIKTLAISDLVAGENVGNMRGWWYKLLMFKPVLGGITGKILFLDLDMIIIDNIDDLFSQPDDFNIVFEWLRKGYNSSVFALDVGSRTSVWDNFVAEPTKIMGAMHGDQDWITKQVNDATAWPEKWCVSFKYHCIKHNKPPAGAKIVLFHGKPNPPEAIIGSVGRYPKAPWVAKYWKK